MALQERLTEDLKGAMKGGEKERTEFLRFLLSHIHNREIEKRGKGEDPHLGEEEVLEVLRKELKRKKESMELFQKGGRNDLFEKEKKELEMLLPYLPPLPGEEDIVRVVREVISGGAKEFSQVMKEAMPRLSGADGKEVTRVVKELLQ